MIAVEHYNRCSMKQPFYNIVSIICDVNSQCPSSFTWKLFCYGLFSKKRLFSQLKMWVFFNYIVYLLHMRLTTDDSTRLHVMSWIRTIYKKVTKYQWQASDMTLPWDTCQIKEIMTVDMSWMITNCCSLLLLSLCGRNNFEGYFYYRTLTLFRREYGDLGGISTLHVCVRQPWVTLWYVYVIGC